MSGKPGRPAGAKTAAAVELNTVRSACPKCGCCERENFRGVPRIVEGPVHLPGVGWFARKIGRRTRCGNQACRQSRIEWEHEGAYPSR